MKRTEIHEDSRLAKRLCYLLRYGAVKEGLDIYMGGTLLGVEGELY